MPTYLVELVCHVCGAPLTVEVEGNDEGDALYRCIAETSQRRCRSCTSRGRFEVKRSKPAEP